MRRDYNQHDFHQLLASPSTFHRQLRKVRQEPVDSFLRPGPAVPPDELSVFVISKVRHYQTYILAPTIANCQEHILSRFSTHSMIFNVSLSNPLLSFNTNLHRFRRLMWAFLRSNFRSLKFRTPAPPRISPCSKSRSPFRTSRSARGSYSQQADASQTSFFSSNLRPYFFTRLAVSAKVSEMAASVERTPGPTLRQIVISIIAARRS